MLILAESAEFDCTYRSPYGAIDVYEAELESGTLIESFEFISYGPYAGRVALFLPSERGTSYLAPKGWDPARDLVAVEGRAA